MQPQRCEGALAPLFRVLLGLVQLISMIQADDACAFGCSSHGSCVEGFCECRSNWAGQDCSYFLESADGDAEDDLEADKCLDDCSKRGVCLSGVCKCQKGWTGVSCNVAAQCTEDCNYPAGSCAAGSCVCAAGFFGPTCGDKTCPSDCFGHGSCVSGICHCSQDWTGKSCENRIDDASVCDPPCMNGASCVNGACYCPEGFSGPDCSLPVAAPASIAAKTLPVQPTAAQSNQSLIMVNALEERLRSVEAELSQLRQVHKAKEAKEASLKQDIKNIPELTKKSKSEKTTNSLAEVHQLTNRSHAEESLAQVVTSSKWGESSSHTEHQSSWGMASLLSEGRSLIHQIEALTQRKLNFNHIFESSGTVEKNNSSMQRQNASNKTVALSSSHGNHNTSSHWDPAPKAAPLKNAQHAVAAANVAADRLKHIAQGSQRKLGALIDEKHSAAKLHATQKAVDDDEDSVALRLGKFQHKAAEKAKKTALASVSTNTTMRCEGDCNGHGTCDASGQCACEPNWIGLICDMPRCPHDCNGRGMCVDAQCVCEGDFYGSYCQHKRCLNDCSSNGYCFQGRCQCKAGYSGNSCEQFVDEGAVVNLKIVENSPKGAPPAIDVPRELSTLRKIPAKTCPMDCSKRGTCHFDGHCECFTGYSGPACQSYCPNECSHQGDCIEGACLCFAGFLGTDCSIKGCCNGHGTCDNPGECVCFPGWAGGDCSLFLMCPDPACSGHGKCKNGKCNCFPGFGGPVCVPQGNCDPPCSPNGFCNPASKKCECKVGFTGPDCSGEVEGCEDDCNGRGLCFNGNCMCGPGWDGHACEKRYMEPGATPPAPSKDAQQAGDAAGESEEKGKSQIVAVGGGGAAAQAAAAGAAQAVNLGPTCGEGGTCSGHGECNTAEGKCDCEPGWDGVLCDTQHCEGWDGTLGSDCFGHGLCNSGACECAPGWGKDPYAANKTAPNVCKDKICPVGCGNYGKCVAGACVCQQGWTGPNCKDPDCGPTACSGHGQCTFVSPHAPGQCMCNYGWGGSQCHREALYSTMRKCANDCSGNGLCLDGKCICNVGFDGPDCTGKICSDPAMTGPRCDLPRCYNDCTGKGLCMNGKCACWLGFSGSDCSIPSQCLEACGNVCEADTGSEKCQYCVGQCETVNKHPVLGVHNPFEDIATTLLQSGKQNATKSHHHHHKEVSTLLLQTSPAHHHHEEVYVESLPVSTLHKRHHEVSVVSLPNSFF